MAGLQLLNVMSRRLMVSRRRLLVRREEFVRSRRRRSLLAMRVMVRLFARKVLTSSFHSRDECVDVRVCVSEFKYVNVRMMISSVVLGSVVSY